jgi:Ca2+-binding EF-hand superfamily protein
LPKFKKFQHLDVDHDHRVSFAEFKKGHEEIGIHGNSDEDLKRAFGSIDTNQGGFILFNEFCLHLAKQQYTKNHT